ncbi:CcoQ/FixQ family Cbb3-type cytochrome c oxidase assembly chaperone [Moraxella sp. FZLJ2107]|uniref:cbb3-type cytochrome oxidase subunit 3 n=1 Tax=unclassified Moraxella TaxID=2685852 RepID=UPI00209BD58D|nr:MULTISPECIES: CcoQ/FixQ family Cbb3-type cytochrome c oxidase assembly chaperone [unclassified Moraxella]USZ14439.1 CcoQ/FixQ family Cbb3-type cytochrome c oxidase assembly chaperone [Moraxella sp. FZFQ2102]UTO05112.1 CcoQ/FixQ family Cbb3-type cytochrome c oxidase assembly chaperone [Moraxella sp. FZLJ2107]UTO21847.1 CcoQ/FixQ family Cbb3-type cytochrome c oxidase assembly chaperone [Moraxella sp. FZLJ2109]
MDLGVLHSIATVSAFIAFIGIAWWAYSPKNKKRFEEDAQLALDDLESSSSQQRTKDTQ